MTKRVTVVVAIGLLAAMAVPSVAFAQDDGQGGSEQSPATEESSGSEESTTTQTEVTPEEPVVSDQTEQQESDSETIEEPETDAIEPDLATRDAGSADDGASAGASTQVASTSVATVSGTNKISNRKAKRGRKGKKSRKASCSTSSGAGGSLLAQASAPVAPGCTRLDGPNGAFNAPDGTLLTVVEVSEGVIEVTVSGAPGGAYSGTLFVKGGPSDPGNPCIFNAVPNGTTVTCTAPVNPNNGKFFGVSHVDACPPGTTPADVPGGERDRSGGQREEQERERRRRAAARERSVAPVAAAAVAAPGGQLPVTGLPVVWLVLVGGGLLASGLALRRTA